MKYTRTKYNLILVWFANIHQFNQIGSKIVIESTTVALNRYIYRSCSI